LYADLQSYDNYEKSQSFYPPFAIHRFPSNPDLTGSFAGSGAAGYAPLATAHDTILVCRALPVLPTSRTLAEQVVS